MEINWKPTGSMDRDELAKRYDTLAAELEIAERAVVDAEREHKDATSTKESVLPRLPAVGKNMMRQVLLQRAEVEAKFEETKRGLDEAVYDVKQIQSRVADVYDELKRSFDPKRPPDRGV